MSGRLPSLPDKAKLLDRVRSARLHWAHSLRPDAIEPTEPGEESVWDYPRPPSVTPCVERLRVDCAGQIIADTVRALIVRETAGAPVPYFPPEDVGTALLIPTDHVTVCEWKGAAVHYDLIADGRRIAQAAYAYPGPLDDLDRGFARIAGWFAFYPAKLDCFVGDETVRPQAGGYYGGWVTDRIKGPIKGAPGSEGW